MRRRERKEEKDRYKTKQFLRNNVLNFLEKETFNFSGLKTSIEILKLIIN